MTAKDLDEQLATITARAKGLRDAGVIGKVTIGDVSFELDGAVPDPMPVVQQQASTPADVDPLDDEVTYGTNGVPRRRKPFNPDAARAEFEKE